RHPRRARSREAPVRPGAGARRRTHRTDRRRTGPGRRRQRDRHRERPRLDARPGAVRRPPGAPRPPGRARDRRRALPGRLLRHRTGHARLLGHPAARRRRTGGPVGRPGPHPVPDLVSHEETRDMETTTALDARAWIDGFIAVIAARSAELTELDRQAGDGDYGTNLRSALRRTETNLNGVADDSPEAVFTAVSDAFLHTGGTSGPLFGMWFREFAKAADGEPTTATLAEGAANAVAAVQRLGKAEVGHKTMVDAMAPAAEALAAAAARGADLPEALRETAA